MFKKILLIVFSMLIIIGKANASIHGTHGLRITGTGDFCPPSASMSWSGTAYPATIYIDANKCTLSSSGYVPVSGYYSVESVVSLNNGDGTTTVQRVRTSSAYLDASKSIAQQEVSVSGSNGSSMYFPGGHEGSVSMCPLLVDSGGKKYTFSEFYCYDGGNVHPPLPPTPPIPDTSCTINGGNALSVSLGTLNRDEIPTVPDSGTAISKTISVNCTGGTVTANMTLNYTPISIGSSQAVKSSTNGVGAAIFYGNKALSPSDVTSLNFLEGSNTLTLGFQAVRDSTVALKDIPTGAFTANAVLVMTQQ
ncbi:fimbrial protein [Lelliottia amnigena]|uniref:fimbrial protein n=1 Tax=Lelliottia amnigena TaxID=61646 RepID=UPI003BA0AF77